MLRFAALALALALAGTGCKKQSQQRPVRVGRDDAAAATAEPRLPAPHPLTKQPEAAGYVADPAGLLQAAGAYVTAPSLAKVGEFVLGTQGPADWALATSALLAGDRLWAGVHVAGEDILYLPLTKAGVAKAQSLLANYAKRGDFGAVELPAPALQLRNNSDRSQTPKPAPTRLAYVDAKAGTLTLAATPQGLATGRELPRQYGARPLWFTTGEARGDHLFGEFPYSRLELVGEGLHELDVTVTARAGQPLPSMKELAPGALSGALGKDLALGASGRWTGYKEAVRELSHQLQAAVDRAGFAGKMMLDPIANQVTRLLKRWNGRVLIGVGPARHVRFALGADDPAAAHHNLVTLSRDVIDNLQLARMFVGNIPNVSIKKTNDGPDVWLLNVGGIVNQLPAEVRTLAEDGRLRIAFSGSAHAGALLVVIGPQADAELKTWVVEANAATSGKEAMKDLVSATLAINPASLLPVLQTGGRREWAAALLGLTAERSPTRVVLRQVEQRFEISVRGPQPDSKSKAAR
ncbi:MAG: hypothetical protein H0T76_01065 [Nannocystis sp.]|nr:hypothetical protein [Nannocystis sp.]MBA3545051.1 hypothetical protein [Nannocystis sp.]